MPLDIAIIGAGIAGLTAAVSLRRSGHRVQVGEHLESFLKTMTADDFPCGRFTKHQPFLARLAQP